MGDYDRAADDQRDIKDLEQLLITRSDLDGLIDVVRDAIVAAQHHRGAESEQFLGFRVQSARLVRVAIEREEALRGLGPTREDLLIQTGPERLELVVSAHR